MVGTHVCKCKGELVRGEEGRCVSEDERDRQRQLKKTKKKKKKKKKQKGEADEEEEEMERRVYPWYYTLAPLSASYLVYKYWRPNLVTSMGIILFVSVSATLS